VIINDGVGDSGWIVRHHRVGVVLPGTGRQHFERSLQEVERLLSDPGISARCRATAARYYDVEAGARRYKELYRLLAGGTLESLVGHV
jgi:glycosyltransferase involved in cell wall biosynthesis